MKGGGLAIVRVNWLDGWEWLTPADTDSLPYLSQDILEPVCCKKRPKIVPDQLLVWRIRAL